MHHKRHLICCIQDLYDKILLVRYNNNNLVLKLSEYVMRLRQFNTRIKQNNIKHVVGGLKSDGV